MKTHVEDEIEDDLAAEEENKLINEEYKTWKKNAPYLYDLVITHALSWPSLTCEWFPDKESPSNKNYTVHRLLLGTHTSGQAQDYVMIANVHIPTRNEKLDRSNYDDERGELGGHNLPPQPRIQVTQKINHNKEVNRARYMPQNPDLIATKAVSGEVYIFDRTKHSSEPDPSGACKPNITLIGQTKEGYGLAWNHYKAGHVISAGEDTNICLWDINSYTRADATIEPTIVCKGHSSVVGDVDWHPSNENIFASVGDDQRLLLWDTRQPQNPASNIHAHEQEILSCAYCPADPNCLLTGSADKTIVLHDLRMPTRKIHTFEAHTDEVLHLSWSPMSATIFASASSDRRVNVWDLAMIGVEQTPDEQEDGPPELLFVHGGHTARPTDFCWAPGKDENWTAATTSEDNIVMVWQPTMRIWAGDQIRIDDSDLEDPMEGIEQTAGPKSASGSQSMSVSVDDE